MIFTDTTKADTFFFLLYPRSSERLSAFFRVSQLLLLF